MQKDRQDTEDICLQRAKIIARICYEKRIEDVRLLDLRTRCPYADFFVIGTGKSAPQIRGVLKDIQAEMAKQKYKLINEAGRGGDDWALIDYGDVVAHIFSSAARDYYQLEELWADAPDIDFSDILRKSTKLAE